MFLKKKVGRYFDRQSYKDFIDRKERASANLIKNLIEEDFNRDKYQARSALDAIRVFNAFQLAKNVDVEVALSLVELYQNCKGRLGLHQADRDYLDYLIKLALNNPPYSELSISDKIDKTPIQMPNSKEIDEAIKAKFYLVMN